MARGSSCRGSELPRFHLQSPPQSAKYLRAELDTLSRGTDSNGLTPHTRDVRSQHVAENLLDRALRIIGAACALLFGIWAPLSYQLQKNGNKGNDAAQEELIRLRKEVEGLSREMRLMGMLRVVDLCENKKDLDACKNLKSNLQLNRLIELITHDSLSPLSISTTSNPLLPATTSVGPTPSGSQDAEVNTADAFVQEAWESTNIYKISQPSNPALPSQVQATKCIELSINTIPVTVMSDPSATPPLLDLLVSTSQQLPQYRRPISYPDFTTNKLISNNYLRLQTWSNPYHDSSDVTARLICAGSSWSWAMLGALAGMVWLVGRIEEKMKGPRARQGL